MYETKYLVAQDLNLHHSFASRLVKHLLRFKYVMQLHSFAISVTPSEASEYSLWTAPSCTSGIFNAAWKMRIHNVKDIILTIYGLEELANGFGLKNEFNFRFCTIFCAIPLNILTVFLDYNLVKERRFLIFLFLKSFVLYIEYITWRGSQRSK